MVVSSGYDGAVTSFKASGDLSTNQYYVVKLTAAMTVGTTSATTDDGIGILQNKPKAANVGAEVMVRGVSKAVAGGTCAYGDWLVSGSDGRLRNDADGDSASSVFVAKALEAAGAAGDVISVLIRPQIGTVS